MIENHLINKIKRPYGTSWDWWHVPGNELPGYFQLSIWDNVAGSFRMRSLLR
jgi:hypothetical protein